MPAVLANAIVPSPGLPRAAIRTLCQLGKGGEARVAGVAPGTDPARQRLVELGFVHGERVKVVAAAPFGMNPIAVRIGTSTFALRRHEAALVELCAD